MKKLIILLLFSTSFSAFSDESLLPLVDELCFEQSESYNEIYSGKSVCKHSNGFISSEGKFKNGKKEDKWTYWNKNGQKSNEINYKDSGKLVNETKYIYYRNGRLKWEKNYHDGSNLVKKTI